MIWSPLLAAAALLAAVDAMAAPVVVPAAAPAAGVERVRKKAPDPPVTQPAVPVAPATPAPAGPAGPELRPAADDAAAPRLGPEKIEADVSTRTVAVTSAFTGTEIIVFGAINNSRQPSAEAGTYDVVVLVEGAGAPSIVRQKSNVGGVWMNTASVRFDGLPLYSAIASTRPIEEIADPPVLVANGIGFGRARMFPAIGSSPTTAEELDAYKSAAIRLKQKDGLYVRKNDGVAFIGRSLFRSNIKLPANIPVGPLEARVFLFRDGAMISTHTAKVDLERQGFERLIYDFAFEHPVWYGILAVVLAASAGLIASAVFQRPTS